MEVISNAKDRAPGWLAATLFGLAMALAPLQVASFAAGASPQGAQALPGGLDHRCECPAVSEHAKPAVSQAAKQSRSGEPPAAPRARPDRAFVSRFSYLDALPAEAPARSLPLYLLSSRLRR